MRLQTIVRLFSFLALAAMVACGEKSSTATTPIAPTPTAFTVTGVWAADVSFQGVAARLTLTLEQKDTAVSGPARLTLPTGIVLLNGVLQGTITGSLLTYSIAVAPGSIPNQPACTGTLAGTMTVNNAATPTMAGPLGVGTSTCTIPFQTTNVTFTRVSTIVATPPTR
jgi:hypothetical protein